MKKTILITLPMTTKQEEKLKEIGEDCDFIFCEGDKVTIGHVQNVHGIIGNINPELLKDAQNLEWLQLNSAGYDRYVESPYLRKNVVLTNARGAYGVAVSEHLLALVFALSKKIHLYRDNQQTQSWLGHGEVKPLHNQTVLVVGLGDIGSQFAKIMKNLGNKIVAIGRTLREAPSYVDELYTLKDLELLLPQADIVVLCLPLTSETKNLFKQKEFAMMKKSALFFNVGRGELVDTKDLMEAVEKQVIAGAGIDVTDPEPLPVDHPLWKVQNILITPHCAGGFHLPETLNHIVEIAYYNLNSYLNKEEFKNRIL